MVHLMKELESYSEIYPNQKFIIWIPHLSKCGYVLLEKAQTHVVEAKDVKWTDLVKIEKDLREEYNLRYVVFRISDESQYREVEEETAETDQ